MKDVTILICDDSLIQRSHTKWELRSLTNANVIYSSNGSGCLEKFKELNPDIVILDLEIPFYKGKKPSAFNGLRLLKTLLLEREKRNFSIALLSNFEHHQSNNDIPRKDVEEITNELRKIGEEQNCPKIHTCRYCRGDEKKFHEENGFFYIDPEGNQNVLLVFDSIHINDYEWFYLDGRRIHNSEKFPNRFKKLEIKTSKNEPLLTESFLEEMEKEMDESYRQGQTKKGKRKIKEERRTKLLKPYFKIINHFLVIK